jgi:hypothetical protein
MTGPDWDDVKSSLLPFQGEGTPFWLCVGAYILSRVNMGELDGYIGVFLLTVFYGRTTDDVPTAVSC